jgi:hypothetical protein
LTIFWRYLDAAGTEVGSSQVFGAREDGEAWLGEHWSELLEVGVDSVALIDDDVEAYRMSLQARS